MYVGVIHLKAVDFGSIESSNPGTVTRLIFFSLHKIKVMDVTEFDDLIKRRRGYKKHPFRPPPNEFVTMLRHEQRNTKSNPPYDFANPPWAPSITIDDYRSRYNDQKIATVGELEKHVKHMKDWHTWLSTNQSNYKGSELGDGKYNLAYKNRMDRLEADVDMRQGQVWGSNNYHKRDLLNVHYRVMQTHPNRHNETETYKLRPAHVTTPMIMQILTQDLDVDHTNIPLILESMRPQTRSSQQ